MKTRINQERLPNARSQIYPQIMKQKKSLIHPKYICHLFREETEDNQ